MRKPLRTLLASTLLVVLTQQASAEAPRFFNNFGLQAPPPPPAWNAQAPIMWADCLPVPENVANKMVATPMPALPLEGGRLWQTEFYSYLDLGIQFLLLQAHEGLLQENGRLSVDFRGMCVQLP